jgi:hypothetical protein
VVSDADMMRAICAAYAACEGSDPEGFYVAVRPLAAGGYEVTLSGWVGDELLLPSDGCVPIEGRTLGEALYVLAAAVCERFAPQRVRSALDTLRRKVEAQ